jgi:hypothetical protein
MAWVIEGMAALLMSGEGDSGTASDEPIEKEHEEIRGSLPFSDDKTSHVLY